MQVTTLEDLFSHPVFIALLVTILLTIANIMVGVSILPKDRRQKGYWLHRGLFVAALLAYAAFLWMFNSQRANPVFHYLVLFYFLVVVPLSRRANVTAHAIIASVGLVLLVAVAAFTLI